MMKKNYRHLLMSLILFAAGFSLYGQSITLGTPSVGACTPDGIKPTSDVTVEVTWSSVNLGDILEVTLQGVDAQSIISTNPVIIDPSTDGNTTVTFTTLADGSTGASIKAEFRTPLTTTVNTTQTTAGTFALQSNTCVSADPSDIETICTDGSETRTLTPGDGTTNPYTDIKWFYINQSGVATEIDASNYVDTDEDTNTTADEIVIDYSEAFWQGLFYDNAGTPEAKFYFTGVDANTCDGLLCVPVVVQAEECYDLALRKTFNTGTLIPGAEVTFTFTIFNQGTKDAFNIDVTDYYDGAQLTNIAYVANSAMVSSGTPPTVTQNGDVFTVDELAAGVNMSFDVSFTINNTFTGDEITNAGEISQFFRQDGAGTPADDSDSTPDGINGNDTVGDDVIDNSGGDEDDHDIATISLTQRVAVGNFIFRDVDGDGVFDSGDGDVGLEDVVVQLYRDDGDNTFELGEDTRITVGADGILGTGDDAADAAYMTDANGFYWFDQLTPGSYFIYVPSSQFDDGEVLDNLLSSRPEGVDDAMDDNADENGQNTLVSGGVVSTVIALALNNEPTSEGGEGTYPGTIINDANINGTVDFAFTPEFRIGNLVWEDRDNDGNAEVGEPGIQGVAVELYADTDNSGTFNTGDTQIGTTTTDADGKYEFRGLYTDDYFVFIPNTGNTGGGEALENYLSSTTDDAAPNDDTGADNNDNGSAVTGDFDGFASAVINLGTGLEPTDELLRSDEGTPTDDDTANGNGGTVPDNRSNVTVDFGFYQTLTLGDLVFFDTNNDGLYDADGADNTASTADDEYGIEGVTVRLLDGSGNPLSPAVTTTTNASGEYSFAGLDPGDYIVEIDLPTGFRSSTGENDATGAHEGASTPDPDNNTNNDDNGNEATTAVTVRSLAITLSTKGEPTDDGDADANTNLTVDFGVVGYSLGNYVWADTDNSGDVSGSETGIANVTLRLLDDSDNPVDDPNQAGTQDYEVTTDGSGFYLFTGLPTGDYKVQVVGSEFATGGELENFIPAIGAAQEDDPEGDVDQNDNGLGISPVVTDLTTSGVTSGVIMLGDGNGFEEPTGESPIGPASTLINAGTNGYDAISNLTLDFGFYQPVDYGDLPDLANGTATGDYETSSANGGPSHIAIAGLQIGATIDDELDGQPSTDADGDDNAGDDEDGVDFTNISFKPGNTVNIPIKVTNNTSGDANLYAFIDWDDNGDFAGTGEAAAVVIVSSTGSGDQTVLVQFTIPTDADINATVGARFRLTTDDLSGGTPSEGAANDGEVEDYILDIDCPMGNCFDINIQINDNSNN